MRDGHRVDVVRIGKGVQILGVLIVASGVIRIILAALLMPGAFDARKYVELLRGIREISGGALAILAGIGLASGKEWGRRFVQKVVVAASLFGLSDVWQAATTGPVGGPAFTAFGWLAAVAFGLWWIRQPSIRAQFEIEDGRGTIMNLIGNAVVVGSVFVAIITYDVETRAAVLQKAHAAASGMSPTRAVPRRPAVGRIV